jgi:hypothetical protein
MEQRRMFKLIYRIVVSGLICSTFATNTPKAAVAASSKQLLTQADFKYLGAFVMPDTTPSGADAQFGRGLTHRYVNGELRMFSAAWNPQSVFEVRVPNLSTKSPYPQAQIVREWGDIYGSKRYTLSGGSEVFGLYWDEADQRLYWSYGDIYNTQTSDDPSVGYSTLNDATGKATPVGAWRFTGRGEKSTMGCVAPIPQWFADAYTGGKRLGAGCGGYFSIITIGPVHVGPALAAFSPPTLPDRSSIPFTNLVGYPFSDPPYSTPDRCHRDPDYIGTGDWVAWAPKNGIGYWTAGDYMFQAALWIDLPDKTGLIFFPTISNGRVWYETSTLHGESVNHWWYLYDPNDLAQVAQGQKQQWEIQPAAEWQIQYPGLTYPLPGWSDLPKNLITGVTYDSTTRRLYVGVAFGDSEHGLYGVPKVYVYEVQSSSNPAEPASPAAPTGLRMR